MRYKNTAFILLMVFALPVFGQIDKQILIGYNKTTNLIFNEPILAYDLGSKDVLIARTNLPQIIKLKSAVENFKETNLTVYTANAYYSFLVNYKENPDTLVYKINPKGLFENKKTSKDIQDTSSIARMAEWVTHFNGKVLASKRSMKMGVLLKGIYIWDEKLFFVIKICNHSSIDYDIDFIKFNIKNSRRLKKSNQQEIEIFPIYSIGKITVGSKLNVTKVVIFNKFSIFDGKDLIIELGEKGERNISLTIPGSTILNAKPLE